MPTVESVGDVVMCNDPCGTEREPVAQLGLVLGHQVRRSIAVTRSCTVLFDADALVVERDRASDMADVFPDKATD